MARNNSVAKTCQVVLLIIIDTLRKDHLRCYGYHRNTTPFLDRLAVQGRRYSMCFSPVPVTLPAHVSVFTSRYPGWNGVGVHNATFFPPSSTWINRLNSAGILTAGFVSSFVLDQRVTRRFDLIYYDDAMTGTELNRNSPRRCADGTIDAVLKWFAKAPKGKPIFCFLHLMDVHGTYDVMDPIAAQFIQDTYDGEPLPVCKIFDPGGIPNIYRLDQLPDFPGHHFGAFYIDRYDGCIAYVDQQIRRLIDQLAETMGSNLTCLITADHGEAFGEDNYWCTHSHTVRPNQTQVPFIIWSSNPRSIVELVDSSKPVSLLDIGPTVVDLFELETGSGERQHGWSLFDQTKNWATRRLFSVSSTEILAFHAEAVEGAVIGSPSRAIDFLCNIEKESSYFNIGVPPQTEWVAEGMMFYNMAGGIGTRVKPVLASYFEQGDNRNLAYQLAQLGYLGMVYSEAKEGVDKFLAPLSPVTGSIDLKLLRSTAEALAAELQIRPALDLGCGSNKELGFIGADRFRLPGVDIILDLDRPLPFADDSFDLVLASHSLEHVTDIMFTMKEIYRICKHGAQVCIIAPYYQQGLNIANPYHEQSFNEHSPRFWTNSRKAAIDKAEYWHPQADYWGLTESDNSPAEMDFHCLRMEFFYFPEYRHLSAEEQRTARKKFIDVCDQIIFHLVAVKEPIKENEMQELAKIMEYYEPPFVTIRRLQERGEKLEAELNQIRRALETRETELGQVQLALKSQGRELGETQAAIKGLESELAQAQTGLKDRDTELGQLRNILGSCEAELGQVRSKGRVITHELDMFRHRKVVRLVNRFFGKSNAWSDISPSFQQLKDDTLIFTKGLRGNKLQPSINLQRVPFVYYPLALERPGLMGILLAPITDLPSSQGSIGIEIVSPSDHIVAQTLVPMSQVDESVPTRFKFSPIADSDQGRFWLRVFVRDTDTPVRVFEWRKYSVFGLGRLQTRAFCGFVFENKK